MSMISVLIPVTLVLLGFAVWAFFYAVRTGQFEELDVPSWEILIEERPGAALAVSAPDAVLEPPAAVMPADERSAAERAAT